MDDDEGDAGKFDGTVDTTDAGVVKGDVELTSVERLESRINC